MNIKVSDGMVCNKELRLRIGTSMASVQLGNENTALKELMEIVKMLLACSLVDWGWNPISLTLKEQSCLS